MIRVTMNLNESDVRNAAELEDAFQARSRAHAVSIALSLTAYITGKLREPGTELLIRRADRTVERLIVPELENAVRKDAAREHQRTG